MNAAQTMVDTLRKAGYTNVIVDLPHSEPLRITRIVAQQGDARGAEALRRALGLGEVRIESTGELSSDITIQLGQDWVQKQSASVAE
jgi:hypothetical protein